MKCSRIVWFLWCCLVMCDPGEAMDGVLDTSFHAPDGYVLWDGGAGYDRGRDVALQQDGKIVVVGYMTNGTDDDLLVLRYDPNGILDTDFAIDGTYIYDGGTGHDIGSAVAIQRDNKILAAGCCSNGADDDILVLRLNADGSPDPSFGTNGVFIYDGGFGIDRALDLKCHVDGFVLITGFSSNGIDNDLLVIRLTEQGRLDTSFDTDGVVRLDGGNGHDLGLRLAVQSNQSIVVTGNIHNGSDMDIAVVRFDATGILDRMFGGTGIVRLDWGDSDRGYGIDLDSHGRVLVTGHMTRPKPNDTDHDIVVLRLDPNGLLDTSFGDNGIALYDGGTREECFDLVVQCDDSILVTGYSGDSYIGGVSKWKLVVLKYGPDGLLDTAFGSEGAFTYDPTEYVEWGYGSALQTDGSIVVVGQAYNGSDDDVILLRLENSPCDVNELNETHLIYTAEDLNAIAAEPNDWDKRFRLMGDIDLSGYAYDRAVIASDMNDTEPGFQGTAFTGVFDGDGHTISHLTITGNSYLGLFGQTGSGARIANLGLQRIAVNGISYCIGGLIGSMRDGDSKGGILINCYTTGSVIGDRDVGGLVGDNSYGNIITSYSTSTVTGYSAVGGLVGDSNSGSITLSYSTGSVAGENSVGGLVGTLERSSITSSYSTGSVIGDRDVGGLVGLIDRGGGLGPITASFWDMETSGQSTSDGGTGLTTAEMQTANTFLEAGWDFIDETENGTEDIWWILEGQDYPRLWWELIPEN